MKINEIVFGAILKLPSTLYTVLKLFLCPPPDGYMKAIGLIWKPRQ